MSRIVFINGEFLTEENAKISVFDRGFLFADGVYEVSAIINGKLIDNQAHLKRLERSLKELDIPHPSSLEEIEKNQLELISRNDLKEGLIYLQVTRGVADRDFNYSDSLKPTLVMFTQAKNLLNNPNQQSGVKVATVSEIRWQRRDIKSVALLAQVMAKNEARKKGAFEAWMVEDDYITEGSSSNAFLIKNNVIITKDLSNKLLHGITRAAVLKLAAQKDLRIEERAFTVAEALSADECFMTSATTFVLGIVEIDGKRISNGRVGPNTKRLFELYVQEVTRNLK